MTSRLPSVLSDLDLPIAELSAAKLDGELFSIDSCFSPIDEIDEPWLRAGALRTGLPERLIAEQRSAAWVWGALDRPPLHHELCVATGARVRTLGVNWMRTREVVIEASEMSTLNGMQLTNPLRTAIDLLRFSAEFGVEERTILHRLMAAFGFDVSDCAVELDARRNLPGKKLAFQRLARTEAELTYS